MIMATETEAPVEITPAERSRLAQREPQVNAKIIQAQLAGIRWHDAVNKIEQVETNCEAIAATHSVDMQPVQARLKEIETIQITAPTNRELIDPTLETERRDLIAKLKRRTPSSKPTWKKPNSCCPSWKPSVWQMLPSSEC